MQSSYSVIKNSSVLNGSNKMQISTDYEAKRINNEYLNEVAIEYEDSSIIDSYKNIGEGILKSAKNQKEQILVKAYSEAEIIEKDAYEKAHKQGLQNGYEDGYKDGYKESYEKHMIQVKEEGEEIRQSANSLLMKAKLEYEEYLSVKKEEIVELAYNMAESIVKEKLERGTGLNSFIESIIEKSRETKTFIIKCNGIHTKELEKNILSWKRQFALNGEIFILEDETMTPGNAVIEKENGKAIVGIDIGFERLREQLF